MLICQGKIYAEDQGRAIAQLVAGDHWVQPETAQQWTEVVIAEAIDSVPPAAIRQQEES